jgi:parallel beta-helix repeat protein
MDRNKMKKMVLNKAYDSSTIISGIPVLVILTILIFTSGCVELEPTQEGLEIFSDSDFETLDFPGSGTIEDPYIIANYTLKKTSYAILIEGTTKHFIIQNCFMEQFYVGISLRYVSTGSGKLINNTIINAYPDSRYIDPGTRFGIGVQHSANIIIANNTIVNADDRGILIRDSENSSILHNHLSGHDISIGLHQAKNITISGNSFSSSFESFYCSEISSVTIQNNFCKGGLRLYDCYNSTIFSNNITDAYSDSEFDYTGHGNGIFTRSSNCLYVNNRFENNQFYGIYLYSSSGPCSNNTLFHNSFLNNNLLNGRQQAADDGENNTWFNSDLFQGNYWSDWNGTGSYNIDGIANSYDLYPLATDNFTLILF